MVLEEEEEARVSCCSDYELLLYTSESWEEGYIYIYTLSLH